MTLYFIILQIYIHTYVIHSYNKPFRSTACMPEAKISPMFAAYCGGKLVKTWHGANNKRFVTNMEARRDKGISQCQVRLPEG